MAYPSIKEPTLFYRSEAPRTDIQSRIRDLVGAPRQHFLRNFLENRLHLNVSSQRLQNFRLEISNFVLPLYNAASTHTNHCMVSVKKIPQMHTVGMSLNSQPYLNLIASLSSLLLRVKFSSFKGITLSQVEAPFSFMNSTARWVFK